ncbi:MAG: ribonuclease H family protein [Bacteroidales bacterium]|nr:ribonuclease H family protein [Bacteroidales bacterium]
MSKSKKYYVVWNGLAPGIYTSWEECKAQVQGVAGAQFKSFASMEEARQALRMAYGDVIKSSRTPVGAEVKRRSVLTVDAAGIVSVVEGTPNPPLLNALAVDAACSGNPGKMEYQGVYVGTGTQLFHYQAPLGTNNIGEFLAIVHGLSYLKKHRLDQVLYTDSATALSWVRQGACKSKLPENERTRELWDYVHRAEQWLRTNSYTTEIRKWDTDRWGEIPADFGRKGR